ncbi:MAG: type II 3-dehydroquinate dehydratase, partial [Bacteroidota bacterium]
RSPNLNLLGKRQTDIYGSTSFEVYLKELQQEFKQVELSYFQSNSEGALVDKIQEVGFAIDGIIINAAAYSHTSIALADALASVPAPAVEVHISNVYKREAFRHHSHLTSNCDGMITGLGLTGYKLAIQYFLDKR